MVIGHYVQEDRLQDINWGAYTGMDAYELLQRETLLLYSNGHSLKCLLPVWKTNLLVPLLRYK